MLSIKTKCLLIELSLLQISSVNIIPGEITYDAVENIGLYYKEGSINHFEQQKKT